MLPPSMQSPRIVLVYLPRPSKSFIAFMFLNLQGMDNPKNGTIFAYRMHTTYANHIFMQNV